MCRNAQADGDIAADRRASRRNALAAERSGEDELHSRLTFEQLELEKIKHGLLSQNDRKSDIITFLNALAGLKHFIGLWRYFK